jgi:2-oxo-4-hydroxy-4-carboxy-5-ureidoimidazoline decarboxylase
MLDLLRARLDNAPDHELAVAAAEQMKITEIRLEKLA